MIQLLSRLFNIRPTEWQRLLILYVMAFLFIAGMTWGEAIAQASFLHQIGVQYLPFVFVGDAILSIVAVAIYTAFVDRIANSTVLIAISLISTVAILSCRVFIAYSMLTVAYPLLYILSRSVKDTFNLHWWTYANSFYDTRSAKRVIPILSTAARVAGIFAGLTTPLLNQTIGSDNIIIVWSSTFILIALFAGLMPWLLRKTHAHEDMQALAASAQPATTMRSSFWRNIREGNRYVLKSSFLRWMALSTFVLIVLFAFLEYQVGKTFQATLGSTEAISNFVGLLTSVTNLLMLPVQLFLLSRIVNWLGLANANLIFPLGTFVLSGSFLAFPGQLAVAAFGQFDYTTFRTAFRNTIDNLLYNAVSLRVKGRARAFINGFVDPFGSLVGGGLLLLVPLAPLFTQYLPALTFMLAFCYLLITLVIRGQYKRALVEMLEQEDYSYLLEAPSDVTINDPTAFTELKKKLKESESPDLKVFIAKLLSEVGGDEAIPVLTELARQSDSQVRSAVVDILVASNSKRDQVEPLLYDFLMDTDSHVRETALSGLKQWENFHNEKFMALALDLSKDIDMNVRLQTLPILIGSGDFFYMAAAIQTLTHILADEDPHRRAQGVHILGQFDDVRFIRNLLDYIGDTEDEVRLEAVLAIESLVQRSLPAALKAQLPIRLTTLLHDPVERIREATLAILGYLNTSETQRTLLQFLGDPSPAIRKAAIGAFVSIGKPILPVLTEARKVVNNPQLAKMATIAMSRIDRERYTEFIHAYIQDNITKMYANHVRLAAIDICTHYPAVSLMRDMLRETNEQLASEIFELLSALHDPKMVNVIEESLYSEVARSRTNAIEAIESFSTPQIAKLIAPLFDRELTPTQLTKVSQEVSGLNPDTTQIFEQLLAPPTDNWMRALTYFAIGEIGVKLRPAMPKPPENPSNADVTMVHKIEPRPAPPAEPTDKRGRRPLPNIDLMGLIADSDTKPSTPPAVPPPPASDSSLEITQASSPPDKDCAPLFSYYQIRGLIAQAADNVNPEIRKAGRAAQRLLSISSANTSTEVNEMLSVIEKIIFLKEVPFFEEMTVDQLKILANVCEEHIYEVDSTIYNEGEPGGALYVVVRGKVGIDREGRRKGSSARLATVEAHSYFGEMTLFDNSARTEKAIAIQDTFTLRIRREPLIALARQHPDLSLKLINVLSQRLRDVTNRIAQLTPTKPRELHKLYDALD